MARPVRRYDGRVMRSRSASVNSKSKTSRFSAWWAREADFGIATTPSWSRAHRMATWAADLP